MEVLGNSVVSSIGNAHGVSTAQVALRWLYQVQNPYNDAVATIFRPRTRATHEHVHVRVLRLFACP